MPQALLKVIHSQSSKLIVFLAEIIYLSTATFGLHKIESKLSKNGMDGLTGTQSILLSWPHKMLMWVKVALNNLAETNRNKEKTANCNIMASTPNVSVWVGVSMDIFLMRRWLVIIDRRNNYCVASPSFLSDGWTAPGGPIWARQRQSPVKHRPEKKLYLIPSSSALNQVREFLVDRDTTRLTTIEPGGSLEKTIQIQSVSFRN